MLSAAKREEAFLELVGHSVAGIRAAHPGLSDANVAQDALVLARVTMYEYDKFLKENKEKGLTEPWGG